VQQTHSFGAIRTLKVHLRDKNQVLREYFPNLDGHEPCFCYIHQTVKWESNE